MLRIWICLCSRIRIENLLHAATGHLDQNSQSIHIFRGFTHGYAVHELCLHIKSLF